MADMDEHEMAMDEDMQDDDGIDSDKQEDGGPNFARGLVKQVARKENDEMNGQQQAKDHVYLPGDPLQEDEELTFDKSAYNMYHEAQTGAPCLSFDIIPDELGENRSEYPMTCYLVCGTQAERAHSNSLIVMKMSQLDKVEDDDSDSEDSYIDDGEDGPKMHCASFKHLGGINRLRHAHIPGRHIVSSWADTGKVHIWDITPQLSAVDTPAAPAHQNADNVKALHTFSGHQTEGYAMDWSRTTPGRLATGSCNRNIHLWQLRDDGSFHVDQRPYNAHEKSVEDIQWSPNENHVFASCSVDQSIRIWDARAAGSKACMINVHAHEADVNVIAWNRNEPFIVSGGDDGIIKVWDLRQIQRGAAVATFKHHTAPITSVEWHPSDSTVFAASGAEDQLSLWDLAVERDDENEAKGKLKDLPPQLLFIHMGQTDIKELHWHPQLPGVVISTAASGFNIFKTISV